MMSIFVQHQNPNIVKVLLEVVSVDVKNCVTVLYLHVMLKQAVKLFLAVAKFVPKYKAFSGI